MSTEKTATQILSEQMALDRAYSMLAEHPELQAEAIAKHYLAHAFLAKELVYMIKMKRYGATGLDEQIQIGLDYIKINHAHDLGIRLEWKKP